MKKQNPDKTELVVSSMIEIYKFLQSRGVRDPSGDDFRFLHLKYHPMDDEQKRIRKLMDNVLEIIMSQNPELSELSIYECLLFDLTQNAIWFPQDYPDVASGYRRVSNNLLNYTASRDIDIPIVNLQVGEKPVKFGLATFYRIDESYKMGEWRETIKSTAGANVSENILSFARLKCPGDAIKSLEYASDVISQLLILLRAVGFPLTAELNLHFGLVNEFQLFQTRPYRLGTPEESYKLNYQPKVVSKLGIGSTVCHLENDILKSLEISDLDNLQVLIENEFLNPHTEVSRKSFLGLHWLGEATKPDTNVARFAKLAFALEALIGGEPEEKKGNLSTRGLTATLAERGAFLVGNNQSERKEVHDRIYDFYGIRSGIVHGGGKGTTNDDLVNFASLIRKISWALLSQIKDFKSLADLQKWVLKQRYS